MAVHVPASEPCRPSGAKPERETSFYGFRCAPPAATVHGPSGAEFPLSPQLVVCGRSSQKLPVSKNY
jgi:hypothetical protein